MTEITVPDFVGTIQADSLTLEQLYELKRRVSAGPIDRNALVAYVEEEEESASRLRAQDKVNEQCLLVGALQWVLARYEDALATLDRVKRNDFARQLEADSLLQLGQHAKAEQAYSKLAPKLETVETYMGWVESLMGKGEKPSRKS